MRARCPGSAALVLACAGVLGCSAPPLEPASRHSTSAPLRHADTALGGRATAAASPGQTSLGAELLDRPNGAAEPECTPASDDVCRFRANLVELASAPALLPTELWTHLHPLAHEAGEMDEMPPSELEPKRWCGDAARLRAQAVLAGTSLVDGCHRAPLYCSAIGHHVETRIYAGRGPGGDPVPWVVVTLGSMPDSRDRARQEGDVRALLARAANQSCPDPR